MRQVRAFFYLLVRVIFFAIAAFAAPLALAQFGPGLNGMSRIQIGDKDFGYYEPNVRWPSLSDGRTIIFVCWESSTAAASPEAGWVKSAVTDSWQRYSKIEFRGWQACAEQNSGIRIQVVDNGSDNGPHTMGLGKALDRLRNGMVLNFTFKTWGPSCASSESERQMCIKSIAVHEFGHAIGFAHEQNRPDKPGECLKPSQGQDGSVLLTPYDPDSVMNYCNLVYNNDGKLSRYDIASVQQVYGTPP